MSTTKKTKTKAKKSTATITKQALLLGTTSYLDCTSYEKDRWLCAALNERLTLEQWIVRELNLAAKGQR